jgi:hypothetical protein
MIKIIIICVILIVIYIGFFVDNKNINDKTCDNFSTVEYKKNHIVIVTNHYNENLDWLYTNKNNKQIVVCSKKNASPQCQVSKNKGREASGYLKYIIDNYDNLPEHIAFIHGHENAWHQTYTLVESIFNCAKYEEHDYIGLNNVFIDDRRINENPIMNKMKDLWINDFEPYLNIPFPDYLLHDCCAQFIVSKKRILKNSLKAYEHWYNMFMETDNDYDLGLLFEYIWHIIFGEPMITTLDENMKKFKKDCLTKAQIT